MNKYIVPIYDDGKVFNRIVIARSNSDCKEKLINQYISEFDIDQDFSNFKEFEKYMRQLNVIFGTIQDVDELC